MEDENLEETQGTPVEAPADTPVEGDYDDDNNSDSGNGGTASLPMKKGSSLIKLVSIIGAVFGLLLLILPFLIVAVIFSGLRDAGDIFSNLDLGAVYNTGSVSGNTNSGTGTSNGNTFAPTTDNTEFWWPVGSTDSLVYDSSTGISVAITSYFGFRIDPDTGKFSFHNAIDIAPSIGVGHGTVNIIAARDGVVEYSGENGCGESTEYTGDHSCGGGLGNYVKIKHSDGFITVYGHMYSGSLTVKTGDKVHQGQVIGKMGSSGYSTGMHLHFGVFINGIYVNPLEYVSISDRRPGLVDNSSNNDNATEDDGTTDNETNNDTSEETNNDVDNNNNNNNGNNNENVEMEQ